MVKDSSALPAVQRQEQWNHLFLYLSYHTSEPPAKPVNFEFRVCPPSIYFSLHILSLLSTFARLLEIISKIFSLVPTWPPYTLFSTYDQHSSVSFFSLSCTLIKALTNAACVRCFCVFFAHIILLLFRFYFVSIIIKNGDVGELIICTLVQHTLNRESVERYSTISRPSASPSS